ncbi:hypothetical protein Cgig2_005192 [Carnegiea gigantea]|uniref:Uncharacterized protein n=1 Tax=Carnegiea gigantea TaxID=171969 RepID=A0A9Q1KFF6_9CARY|nr:hypothetical protein Cgig2_005192 [Carnegiea gigantea]
MGCFSTCFGNSKRQRRSRRRSIRASPSLLDHLQKYESIEDFKVPHLIEEEKIENPIDPSSESTDEKGEKATVSERKKVTFDLNVKVYEELPTEEEEEIVNEGEINGEQRKEGSKKEESASDSSSSSLFSYPLNHRYQNCRDSDDEFDDLLSSDESKIDDFTDDEDDYNEEVDSEVNREKPVMGAQDQSSESLFSLSIESRMQNAGAETGENKEVNSPMPIKNQTLNAQSDRSNYVDSVLNPVENVTQWKVIKAKSRQTACKKNLEAKENLENSGFVVKKEEREIGVDASLSSWLVGSEAALGATTPNSKSSSISVGNSGSVTPTVSPNKFEDRPILGALTIDEIRQFSASSSPRKSPGWSPDDKPIIGSVGSYWSHTGHSTKSGSSTRSKFAENAKVIWDPTPFETRLEKALEEEGTVEEGLRT